MKRVLLTTMVFLSSLMASEPLTKSEALVYINTLRQKAGLVTLQSNPLLDETAKNHARYLTLNPNHFGHVEVSGDGGYTGATPTDRGRFVGYQTGVRENISGGQPSFGLSVDGLFSAIYHRLGFLSFDIDEIGIESNGTNYVYNMGQSTLEQLCQGVNFTGYGTYYTKVCLDPNFNIESSVYDEAKKMVSLRNESVVMYPYPDQIGVDPLFFEEDPDPLPDAHVSGYPVSISFNPSKVGSVTQKSFRLFEGSAEVADVRLLDDKSDPAKKLTSYDFVLFPMKQLKPATSYVVEGIFNVDGVDHNYTWSFTTKVPPSRSYRITAQDQSVSVVSGVPYMMIFEALTPQEQISGYGYEGWVNMDDMTLGVMNDLKFTPRGDMGKTATITVQTTQGERKLVVTLASQDSALTQPTTYPLSHPSGWSLLSLPVNRTVQENELATLFGHVKIVWKYGAQGWQGWSPDPTVMANISSHYGVMTSLEAGEGFWVYSLESRTLQISGDALSAFVDVGAGTQKHGWALRGYGGDKISSRVMMRGDHSIGALWGYQKGAWKLFPSPSLTSSQILPLEGLSGGEGVWIYRP